VSRNAWQEEIAQTQLVLQDGPDYCFVCEELVPDAAPDALIQAYLDAAHQERLAVVCGRRACRLALQDAANGTWQRLFGALTHWPDTAIYPHGPYWAIRRPHQLTFRTDPRRTTIVDATSADDPDDATTLPRTEEHRPVPPRPLGGARRGPTRKPAGPSAIPRERGGRPPRRSGG
jgi:hypothetical protein